MRRLVFLLLPLLLVGCAGGHFKIPRQDYRQQVQTLGVVPILVDDGSAIAHPDRQGVVELLYRHSASKEGRLIELLKEQKGYFDIRPVAGDPGRLFRRLARERTLAGEGPAKYWHYRFDPDAVAQLSQKEVVDALLVVILNGVKRPQKRWDRTHLTYLEAQNDVIQATAAVVSPAGEILWEYPGAADEVFLHLQYPDFDEAYYNRTDQVKLKYVTVEGLDRTLAEPVERAFSRDIFPRPYLRLFEDLASDLKPGLINPLRYWTPWSGDRQGAAR